MEKSTRRARSRETRLLIFIATMMTIVAVLQPKFLQVSNFLSLARSFSIEGVALIGMTILLVSGVFDISVGSVMALSGIVCAMLIAAKVNYILAILICVALGVAAGLINGFLITQFKINAFIVTFGMLSLARGIAVTITDAKPIRIAHTAFTNIGMGTVLGIPITLIILVSLTAFFDFSMRRVRFFRQFYFIGCSEVSAELTGINVRNMRIVSYALMGALAAISGMLSSSRLAGSVPMAYIGLELKLIVAAVIGGCTLDGGQGTVLGSMLGLIILFLLNNAMTLLGVSMYWENFILGSFLILVVLLNILSARRQIQHKTVAKEVMAVRTE